VEGLLADVRDFLAVLDGLRAEQVPSVWASGLRAALVAERLAEAECALATLPERLMALMHGVLRLPRRGSS
jgi:hypothetical protein